MKNLSVGDVFYEVRRQKLGFTKVSTTVVYPIRVTAVGEGYFEASWNENPPCKYYYGVCKSWRKRKPFLREVGFAMRLSSKTERCGDNVTIVERSTYFLVKTK